MFGAADTPPLLVKVTKQVRPNSQAAGFEQRPQLSAAAPTARGLFHLVEDAKPESSVCLRASAKNICDIMRGGGTVVHGLKARRRRLLEFYRAGLCALRRERRATRATWTTA